jgi:hypothetical protein
MTRRSNILAVAVAASILLPAHALASVTDFEDFPLAPNSHYFPGVSSEIEIDGLRFNHDYDSYYGSWGGWTVSNERDFTTAGYLNQFSAYLPSSTEPNNYALAYTSVGGWGTVPVIAFATPSVVDGAYFANTTYAALSMLYGDGFAKAFGGASGNDPDYFVLNITGHDAEGAITGVVDFYLADYRFADNSLDYIVGDWTYVNLSSLGTVSSLSFSMDSSDFSPYGYGINTPAYFALDRLSASPVPWPAAPWMYGAGLALLGWVRRRTA